MASTYKIPWPHPTRHHKLHAVRSVQPFLHGQYLILALRYIVPRYFPQNLPLPVEGISTPHLRYGSLGPLDPSSQSASQSKQPIFARIHANKIKLEFHRTDTDTDIRDAPIV